MNLGYRKSLHWEHCYKFISEVSLWMREGQLRSCCLILWGYNVCQMAFLQQWKEQSYVHSTPHRCVAVHRHVPRHFSLARYHFHIFFVAEANIRGEGPIEQEAVYLSTLHAALRLSSIKVRTLRFCKKVFQLPFFGLEFMSRLPLLTCSQLFQNCFYHTLLNLKSIKVSAQKCVASIK